MALKQVPWKLVQAVLRDVRNTFYKVSPSIDPQVVVSLSPEELDHVLRDEYYYEDLSDYTYKYKGEVLNLRRPAGLRNGYQMAVHVRGFEHEDGTALMAHYEISRWDDPRAHLNGKHFSWQEGFHILQGDLEELDLPWEYYDL